MASARICEGRVCRPVFDTDIRNMGVHSGLCLSHLLDGVSDGLQTSLKLIKCRPTKPKTKATVGLFEPVSRANSSTMLLEQDRTELISVNIHAFTDHWEADDTTLWYDYIDGVFVHVCPLEDHVAADRYLGQDWGEKVATSS